MKDIEFRRTSPADAADLVTLRRAFLIEVDGKEVHGEQLAQAMIDYFRRAIPSGDYVGFLALQGNAIIGNAGLVWHCYPPSGVALDGVRAHLLNVYVQPAWRRRGIAVELVRQAIDFAHARRCSRITLHAVPAGRHLYERLGFAATNSEMRYEFDSLAPSAQTPCRAPRDDGSLTGV